ncbi:hypothetical protein [Paenibacillus sp. NFR01]|uniref:hypothetical protein n=1 Tax=Paenibacillus sp. NFR01 TaxID=1566279 RepID=UPI0008D4CF90|nr:hypothetical protein [Paenibacillus sp. NFR01]SEU02523.1 hypothetical protein SAMN03159358_3153 [Paenibacillus sp. NFR01]
MKKTVPYLMAAGLMAAVLLSGCGANSDNAASAAGGGQKAQTQTGSAAQNGQAGGRGQNGMNGFMNMNLGKIKSINGNTITVYTAEMPSGMRQGGNGGNGQGAGADGQQGTPPEGGQALGTEGGNSRGAGAGGQRGGGQGGFGGGRMQQNFSEETTDITVGSDTQIVSVTFDNNEQKETALSLADLKAGDVIRYTLKSDSTETEKITLGGFGGGGGGFGGGPNGGGNGAPGADTGTDTGADSGAGA